MTKTLTAEPQNASPPGTFRGAIALADSWSAYAAAAARALDAPPDSLSPHFPALNLAPARAALAPVASYYELAFECCTADDDTSSAADELLAKARQGVPGRQDHIVVALASGPYAVVAAVFALATGKRLMIDGAADEPDILNWPPGSSSVTLAGPAHLFSKPALRRLLGQWRGQSDDFSGVGILTARTPEELSTVVCRQLMQRWWRATGRRSALPPDTEPPGVRGMVPLEYYVLMAHGSETHLDYTDDEVLCTDPALTYAGEGRWSCGESAHIPARQLAVHHLIVLSCDLFTPAGGLAPAGNGLFHDLMAGWPSSFVAPFRHAQVNAGYGIVANGLVRAGYRLGEITRVLNGIGARGSEPSAAYLLFGDPETRIVSEAAEPSAGPDITQDDGTLLVSAVPKARRVIDCTIDDERIDGGGRAIAPTPVSAALAIPDAIVATLPAANANRTRFVIVASRDLPDEPLSFRIGSVAGLPDADRIDLLQRVGRLDFLDHLGLDAGLVRTLRERLLLPIRQAAAFPRPIDFMLGAPAAEYATALLEPDLASVRRQVLNELLGVIARDRSWFSHRYRKTYFKVSPGVLPAAALCPECGGGLARWLYEDPAGRAESRTVDLCERCGIVADQPARHPVLVDFAVGNGMPGRRHRLQFVISNQLDEPLAGSVAAHFNEWEALGIQADPPVIDFDLPPLGRTSVEIEYALAEVRPPDLISLHCYAMTDRCDLSAFTRRLVLGAQPENPL